MAGYCGALERACAVRGVPTAHEGMTVYCSRSLSFSVAGKGLDFYMKCWQLIRDFPGGPVVRTLRFHCRGHGFDPWLHSMAQKKKKKKIRTVKETTVESDRSHLQIAFSLCL